MIYVILLLGRPHLIYADHLIFEMKIIIIFVSLMASSLCYRFSYVLLHTSSFYYCEGELHQNGEEERDKMLEMTMIYY